MLMVCLKLLLVPGEAQRYSRFVLIASTVKDSAV
jgi:hypothetical protein